MKLSDINPFPAYFDRYMELANDVPHLEALKTARNDLNSIPLNIWQQLEDRVYAPGKWTVKSILQHLIDTERIFLYRALSYARREKEKVLGFDENSYASHAPVSHRNLEDLLEELKHTHLSSEYLFKSFPDSVLHYPCQGFAGQYIVGAIPFILLGHQRWHFRVLEERYYPLITN